MDDSHIPLHRIATFVSHHTHNVRNGLNSIDLEAALLQELSTDAETTSSLERIRKQLRTLVLQLRTLSGQIHEPHPAPGPISARVLFVIWRQKHAALLPDAPEVTWLDEVGEEKVNVDVEMMATVFRELLVNAALFSKGVPVTVSARSEAGQVVFEMSEPKAEAVDTQSWGLPFHTTRRGAYGLGLWSAHRLMAANHLTLEQQYHPETKCLTSRVVLPAV